METFLTEFGTQEPYSNAKLWLLDSFYPILWFAKTYKRDNIYRTVFEL